jgi:hypothetical protein
MKYKFICLLLIISALIFFSCRKNALDTINKNAVSLYSCSEKTQDMPYICFDSLIEDSRCPKGGVCFWSGTAIIRASFHENRHSYTFLMSLKDYPGLGYTSDTTINDYKISFTDLAPFPDINRHAQAVHDVKATFRISHQ